MKRLAVLPVLLLAACSTPTAASVWKRYESTGRPQIEAPIEALSCMLEDLGRTTLRSAAPGRSYPTPLK